MPAKSISASEVELYKQLVDLTPLCIKAFDKDGTLIFINQGGRKEHFIKDTDNISKWDWMVTVKEKYRPELTEAFKKGFDGQSSRMLFEHTPEGSDHQWCEGVISPVRDEDGNLLFLLLYSMDVTERELAKRTGQS